MLRVTKLNSIPDSQIKYIFCAFEIYWRNLQSEQHPNVSIIDPKSRSILIMPSIFHQGNDSMISYNLIGITLKSIEKVLIDANFPFSTDNKLFHRCHYRDIEVEIKTDSDLYGALMAAKEYKRTSGENTMLIIAGNFSMSENGLENLSIPKLTIGTSENDVTNPDITKDELTASESSKNVNSNGWLKSYIDDVIIDWFKCKTEIIEDLTEKITKGFMKTMHVDEVLFDRGSEVIPNSIELNYIRRMRSVFGVNWYNKPLFGPQ